MLLPAPHLAVRTDDEVIEALRTQLTLATRETSAGVLLSGGIDSAILAALMPRGTRAYTIRFNAPGAVDESPVARAYCAYTGLDHRVVDVDWSDYEALADALMRRKRAPLHPVEVGLAKASLQAARDGVSTLVVGNGADSTFGGLDRLLTRDWRFDEFVTRYTFVAPTRVLREPACVMPIFERYRRGDDGIDMQGFLNVVHGTGVTQAFDNAIAFGGCTMTSPYEALAFAEPLDLPRIRRGDSKYVLRAVFATLYGSSAAPERIAFAPPLDCWLARWRGPDRPEFRGDVDWQALSGEQRWLVRCLDRFFTQLDASDD